MLVVQVFTCPLTESVYGHGVKDVYKTISLNRSHQLQKVKRRIYMKIFCVRSPFKLTGGPGLYWHFCNAKSNCLTSMSQLRWLLLPACNWIKLLKSTMTAGMRLKPPRQLNFLEANRCESELLQICWIRLFPIRGTTRQVEVNTPLVGSHFANDWHS